MVGITAAGQKTSQAIQREAARLFAEHGFEATALREIAGAVGIKVGSLYNHMNSKDDLLISIMGGSVDDLNAEMTSALAGLDDPIDRFIAFMACHVRFHAGRAQEVFIGNSELRSLPADARAEITLKRKQYQELVEQLLLGVLQESVEEHLSLRLHAFSIVAIGTHVATWYRPDGALGLDEIITTYTKIVLRSLGVPDADRRVDRSLDLT